MPDESTTQAFSFLDPPPLIDRELSVVLVQTEPAIPEINFYPQYRFLMIVDAQHAGGIRLRIDHTGQLSTYHGHIGYEVLPAYRGNRYAERAARLLLPLALAHGMTTLWITTNPDNTPSRRTCERLGATYIETVDVPPGTPMYAVGDRQKCRYRLDLDAP